MICAIFKFTLIQFILLKHYAQAKERIIMHWKCECRNINIDIQDPYHTACHTKGVDINEIETYNKQNISWSFSRVGVSEIVKKCFIPRNKTLKEITVTKMKYIDEFAKDTFTYLQNVQAITISNTPFLRFLPIGIFIPLNSLRVLRITHTGLEEVPILPGLKKHIMHIVDFESNKIKLIKSNALSIQTEQLILDYNNIMKIDCWAFNGSQIGKLSLKGNRALTDLSRDAFRGLHSLRDLDLSETSITFLPVLGLESLETLILKRTNTLKVIPSIHDLKSLLVAKLTYSFHCCAFKYPARHDPVRHELHQEYLIRVKELCKVSTSSLISSDTNLNNENHRSKREYNGVFGPIIGNRIDIARSSSEANEISGVNNYNTGFGRFHQNYDAIQDSTNTKDFYNSESSNEIWGSVRVNNDTTTSNDNIFKFQAICGNVKIRHVPVDCSPESDALNPCEDIMGYDWLRISVWLVISTALFGNTAVLVVLLANRSDTNVPRFLIMNLAFSDLLMAVYLLLLALSDLRSTGFYFNYAYDWQRGYGCKLAGVLTVFSSQLSVYTLSLITLERWFAIKKALYENKFNLKVACFAMLFGWIYSIVMAVLPLFGISSYSTTSICLPMDIQTLSSLLYVLCLLLFTGIAFILISVCYIQIYRSLGTKTRHCPGESSVARKMMLLVGTNFACCAPVAFFSLTALAGYPLIDVTNSKILLVFFYPINSCANPYLYAILTSQYRKQLIQLLSRFGLFKDFAQRYKLGYSTKTISNSRTPSVKYHKWWFSRSKSTDACSDPLQ